MVRSIAALAATCAAVLWTTAGQSADVRMGSAAVVSQGAGAFVCYLTNLGAAAVRLRDPQLASAEGSYPLVTNTCGASLQPTKTCAFATAAAAGRRTAFCRATVGRRPDMRGRVEARSADGTVNDSAPLE